MSAAHSFGRIEVRPRERQLLIDGAPAAVGARAFDLLLALIERSDRLVTKSELLDVVWPGVVVEENNLQVQISALRKLLGPRSIATVPGRGYRLAVALDGAGVADGPGDSTLPATETGAPAPSRSNLPREVPVLYGRADELRALGDLLLARRQVTIVGAGGIGKSRLAQAAALAALDRHADGAWMVELAGLSDPALVPNTVAGALGVSVARTDTAIAELVAAIASRNMLLVLDNCEHLLEGVRPLVAALRQGAAGVTVLATSQEPLHLPEEQQFRLMPLAVAAATSADAARAFGATALFEARVRAVDARFALTDDTTPLAVDICRQLDGLPLAIELAAARVGALGLRAVRDRLDARFKLLTGGARTTLRRHQTLRAALEWSHGLLDETERTVFRRLGVFAGGFTMELAQAVAADGQLDDWAVLEVLSALVDKSLVVADAGETPRYRLLESARAFALEQLAATETADVLRRHAEAMLAFMRTVDDVNLDGEMRTDQYAALVLPELDNLRAAYAWANGPSGDRAVAIGLAAHAGSLVDYTIECAGWLLPHRAEVEKGATDEAVAARYWRALAAGNMAVHQTLSQCVDAAERAVALYRSQGRPRRLFASLTRLARYREVQGDDAAAQSVLAEARALLRPEWPTELHIHMLRRETTLARRAGRVADALATLRVELRLSEAAGDWRLQAIARNNLIDLLWESGSNGEAAQEAERLANDLRRRPAAATDTDVVFANLVGILCEMDRFDEALRAADALLPLLKGARFGFLEEWIYLFTRLGQPEVAAVLLGALDAFSQATGLSPEGNEKRLIGKATAEIEARLKAEDLAQFRATGAALDDRRIFDLVSGALAQAGPARNCREAPSAGGA